MHNQYAQAIGTELSNWNPRALPTAEVIAGTSCSLVRMNGDLHAQDLYHSITATGDDTPLWTYMAYGPFASYQDYQQWATASSESTDPLYYVIIDKQTGTALGHASYLRINPIMGSIEVGNILFASALQKTRAATESMYLMMKHAFDLGYRRYEWKCDDLNAPSRAAALRLGFTYEGTFRQAIVYKNRNRDTAWYSIIDSEWPVLQRAYEQWLAEDNFDSVGRQKKSLRSFYVEGIL